MNEMNEELNRFTAKTLVKYPKLIPDFLRNGVAGLVAKAPLSHVEKEIKRK